MRHKLATAGLVAAIAAATGAAGIGAGAPGAAAAGVWRPAHTVVVVMETYGYNQIIGSSQAPYINSLANANALLTNYHSIGHPSEPNYMELFSGSTQGVSDDNCPYNFKAANLYTELAAASVSFAAYTESQPGVGYRGCATGEYVRRHDPWANFTNVPGSVMQPFSSFPTDYSKLPTVSYVIPNLIDDMHDAAPPQGDAWLKANIDPYVQWAKKNDSLLILTWDEADDNANGNQVATILAGSNVVPGRYGANYTHASLLRTIEDAYGLAPLGNTASAAPFAAFGAASAGASVPAKPAATLPKTVKKTVKKTPKKTVKHKKATVKKTVKKTVKRTTTPTRTAPATDSFAFANGTTDGWFVDYGPARIASASSGASGTHGLAITLTGAGNPGIASPHLPGVGAGARVTYRVYEPKNLSLTVQPYAQDGAWHAHFSTTTGLRQGGWTTISWTLPALSGGLRYVGLEVENGGGQHGTLVLNSVTA